MDTTMVDALVVFLAGMCAAFLLYGGWLCLRYGSDVQAPSKTQASPRQTKEVPACHARNGLLERSQG